MNKENYKSNMELIIKIAKRADDEDLLIFDRLSLIMDLECCINLFELRLEDFLNADSFNFTHDIIGIQNNLNRETKQMENCFVPRFSKNDTNNI